MLQKLMGKQCEGAVETIRVDRRRVVRPEDIFIDSPDRERPYIIILVLFTCILHIINFLTVHIQILLLLFFLSLFILHYFLILSFLIVVYALLFSAAVVSYCCLYSISFCFCCFLPLFILYYFLLLLFLPVDYTI